MGNLRRSWSDEEKSDLIAKVNEKVKAGSWVKQACKELEISDGNYRQWVKRLGKPKQKAYTRKSPFKIDLPVVEGNSSRLMAVFGTQSDILALVRGLQ